MAPFFTGPPISVAAQKREAGHDRTLCGHFCPARDHSQLPTLGGMDNCKNQRDEGTLSRTRNLASHHGRALALPFYFSHPFLYASSLIMYI